MSNVTPDFVPQLIRRQTRKADDTFSILANRAISNDRAEIFPTEIRDFQKAPFASVIPDYGHLANPTFPKENDAGPVRRLTTPHKLQGRGSVGKPSRAW